MKDKLVSALLGAVLGGLIIFLYMNITSVSQSNILPNGNMPVRGTGATFDTLNMTDDQLEKMATRAGLTKEELKSKLDSGEDIRSLMGNSTGGFNGRYTGSGTVGQ